MTNPCIWINITCTYGCETSTIRIIIINFGTIAHQTQAGSHSTLNWIVTAATGEVQAGNWISYSIILNSDELITVALGSSTIIVNLTATALGASILITYNVETLVG